jgi:hypothetical protein
MRMDKVIKFPLQTTFKNSPLCIGLEGPPGGGKTASALLIAQGIQAVRGGNIRVLDTEGGRAAKYLGESIRGGPPFQFEFALMEEPFRADYFIKAITELSAGNPACLIIDSISDEHEGPGGRLSWGKEETRRILERQNKDKSGYNWEHDWEGQKRVAMSAWQPSSEARKALAQKILRHPIPLILTFRAREKLSMVEVENKNGRKVAEPTKMGFQPIAAAEITHTCDLLALLPVRADGVPTWKGQNAYEDFTIKLPEFFKPVFAVPGPISRYHGEQMARWARGERKLAALPEPKVSTGNNGNNGNAEGAEPKIWAWAVGFVRDHGLAALTEKVKTLNQMQQEYLAARWPQLEDIAAEKAA